MQYSDLKTFILNNMRMSHIYQPVMIKALVKSDDSLSATEIAREFQNYLFRRTVLPGGRITLSGIIWRQYGDETRKQLICTHDCKEPKCTCPIILVNDETKLKSLQSYSSKD